MPLNIRRGLGLLVVALMSWVVGAIAVQYERDHLAIELLSVIAAASAVVCAVVGLVLLAIGLLRE